MFLVPPWVYFSAMHTVSFAGWAVVTETPLNGNFLGEFCSPWLEPGWKGLAALLDVGSLATWGYPLWSLQIFSLLTNALLLGGRAPCRIN